MHTKAYLLIYNYEVGSRTDVINTLNSMTTLSMWRYDMDNVFYIISSSSAQQMSDEFRTRLPSGRFMFSEIATKNMQGIMLTETWTLLNTHQLPPEPAK